MKQHATKDRVALLQIRDFCDSSPYVRDMDFESLGSAPGGEELFVVGGHFISIGPPDELMSGTYGVNVLIRSDLSKEAAMESLASIMKLIGRDTHFEDMKPGGGK
jgi:hypothetical protein